MVRDTHPFYRFFPSPRFRGYDYISSFLPPSFLRFPFRMPVQSNDVWNTGRSIASFIGWRTENGVPRQMDQPTKNEGNWKWKLFWYRPPCQIRHSLGKRKALSSGTKNRSMSYIVPPFPQFSHVRVRRFVFFEHASC